MSRYLLYILTYHCCLENIIDIISKKTTLNNNLVVVI